MNAPGTIPEPQKIKLPEDVILFEGQKLAINSVFGPIDNAKFGPTDMEFAFKNVRSDGSVHEYPAPALRAQSRPAKKQMITHLHAASFCLSTATDRDGVIKALDVLSRLCDDDFTHAKNWLGGTEPIAAKLDLGNVDKLLALIESLERVRPKLRAAAAAAKVRAALAGIAGTAAHDDPDKLKAQIEN